MNQERQPLLIGAFPTSSSRRSDGYTAVLNVEIDDDILRLESTSVSCDPLVVSKLTGINQLISYAVLGLLSLAALFALTTAYQVTVKAPGTQLAVSFGVLTFFSYSCLCLILAIRSHKQVFSKSNTQTLDSQESLLPGAFPASLHTRETNTTLPMSSHLLAFLVTERHPTVQQLSPKLAVELESVKWHAAHPCSLLQLGQRTHLAYLLGLLKSSILSSLLCKSMFCLESRSDTVIWTLAFLFGPGLVFYGLQTISEFELHVWPIEQRGRGFGAVVECVDIRKIVQDMERKRQIQVEWVSQKVGLVWGIRARKAMNVFIFDN
ncbi:hypothetical protein BCR33DRAFT_446029 [Rhizoclosmatium globosum]|uniref:Uncharacterized protein n=1 Tax=Rhizoclosmatium globosum TaxID=329046 RepID=A0A1Y2BSS4_9FUNG|nr:hypothetical protein BCR33DRAFT_446029 [Rhizoclosmatium globosum]|eukprot:ORY37793.1 hypothetical protein BCR33DRAFT_446029 [Rhizoclosmatium globosum]